MVETGSLIASFFLRNFLTSSISTRGAGLCCNFVSGFVVVVVARSSGCNPGANPWTFLNANPNLTRGFQERSKSVIMKSFPTKGSCKALKKKKKKRIPIKL